MSLREPALNLANVVLDATNHDIIEGFFRDRAATVKPLRVENLK